MDRIMNGTGEMHPPATLNKARGAWGAERALLANGCRKELSPGSSDLSVESGAAGLK